MRPPLPTTIKNTIHPVGAHSVRPLVTVTFSACGISVQNGRFTALGEASPAVACFAHRLGGLCPPRSPPAGVRTSPQTPAARLRRFCFFCFQKIIKISAYLLHYSEKCSIIFRILYSGNMAYFTAPIIKEEQNWLRQRQSAKPRLTRNTP